MCIYIYVIYRYMYIYIYILYIIFLGPGTRPGPGVQARSPGRDPMRFSPHWTSHPCGDLT